MKPNQAVIVDASSPAAPDSDVAILARMLQFEVPENLKKHMKISTTTFTTVGSYTKDEIDSAKAVISTMEQQLPKWLQNALQTENLDKATRRLANPKYSGDAEAIAKIFLTAIRDLCMILENENVATASAVPSSLKK